LPLPFPTSWYIEVSHGSMPTNAGTLIIQSVANGRVRGTLNFRGTPFPISGTWNEQANHLFFQSPYANFNGTLSIYREPLYIHYTLQGNYLSTLRASFPGDIGTWYATTAIYVGAS
jgi:hypothetical protein